MKEISGVHAQVGLHRHAVTQTQAPDQGARNTLNPAKAARAALLDRPDLAGKPFGHLVSLFARGLPLPEAENAAPEVAPPDETGTTESSGDTTVV